VDRFDKQVSQAALDVAIERMTTLYPSQQSCVFGGKGDPFWAHFQPTREEVEVLTRALSVLEGVASTPAPLTVRGASGQFTAMVLDEERTLFLVLLAKSSPRPSAEARARRVPDLTSARSVRT
jgi:hypothetical protein